MTPSWIDTLRSARVYDLEQPRFAGMPIHPVHRPGYFYALHRRHRDTHDPAAHGPRSSASGVLTLMEHTGTHRAKISISVGFRPRASGCSDDRFVDTGRTQHIDPGQGHDAHLG